VKQFLPLLAALSIACSHAPKRPLERLAVHLPADATVVAGLDLDRLRAGPLFAKLPESFRDGSYALAAFNGRDVVIATLAAGHVTVSGPGGTGAPPDLMQHAAEAPLWIAARGGATLPLTGNLANINRLLHQTEYTTVAASVGEHIDLQIAGLCLTPEDARHLEENIRAIASLMKLPFTVVRDGAVVRVEGSVSADVAGKLLR